MAPHVQHGMSDVVKPDIFFILFVDITIDDYVGLGVVVVRCNSLLTQQPVAGVACTE